MSASTDTVWAVVPGRMGSKRLPGKTMADLRGTPSLEHIMRRLHSVPSLDGIMVATTTEPEDDVIESHIRALGIPVFRGSQSDVMDRTLRAAKSVGAGTIVTVNGDCPLIDPRLVEQAIAAYRTTVVDYASNFLNGHVLPRGMEVEAFSVAALCELEREATEDRDREHVTLRFYEDQSSYRVLEVPVIARHRRPKLRLTLDTTADLGLITALYDALYDEEPNFGLDAMLEHLDQHPELGRLNAHIMQKKA